MTQTVLFATSLAFIAIMPVKAFVSEPFIDPEDGYLDASQYLLDNAYGFLPVPIIFNEPAVGFGAGATLLFFHADETARQAEPGKIEADISGFTAYGTDNGSWGFGGFHMGRYFDDRVRLFSAAFHFDSELDFYGLADLGQSQLNPSVRFLSQADFLSQKLQWRPRHYPLYLGLDYRWLNLETEFLLSELIPILPDLTDKRRDASMGLTFQWDNRDLALNPQQGWNLEAAHYWHGPEWGGDDRYRRMDGHLHQHWQIDSHWNWATRIKGNRVDGDLPFYLKPYIDMRGIPAVRYQGDKTLLIEGQLTLQLHPRWSALAFGGSGWAGRHQMELFETSSRISYGVGFRYTIARLMGLQMGLDWAKGPEQSSLYIQFGHAWAMD